MQYYRNRAHARSHSDEAISVIVDGMTQKTTEIPYFTCGAPNSIPTLRYGLHVFGLLVHDKTPLGSSHKKNTRIRVFFARNQCRKLRG
jgi:hypothetical protein